MTVNNKYHFTHKTFFQVSLIIGLFIIVIFYTRCSEKSLSFFFDGVPDRAHDSIAAYKLDSIAKADSLRKAALLNKTMEPSLKLHQPYKDKTCDACHDNDHKGKFADPISGLCYNCHDDFKNKYKVLHMPVEGGMCTSCHHPHASKFNKLVIQETQALCFTCHDQKELLTKEPHTEIGTTSCTECHNPHGGEDKILLK